VASNTVRARPDNRRTAMAGQQYGQGAPAMYGQSPYDPSVGSAYANYQELQNKKTPVGWWIAGAALVIVIVVIAVLAIRAVTGGSGSTSGVPSGQPSQDVCPAESTPTAEPSSDPADGRVHGGPVSYPMLGQPWSSHKVTAGSVRKRCEKSGRACRAGL
jgi:hypothetical protein